MAVFELVEYRPDSSGNYVATGNVYTFVPLPKSIKKDLKWENRIRNHGLALFKLVRWRNRLTEAYTISGDTSVYKILELQHYYKRHSRDSQSKFKIRTDIDALKIVKEPYWENGILKPTTPTLAGSGTPWVSDNFFVITDLSIDIPSGKPLGTFNSSDTKICVTYNLKLELVE